MATWTIDANGNTEPRSGTVRLNAGAVAVPAPGATPNMDHAEWTWVNNSGSAITIDYTFPAPASTGNVTSHEWNYNDNGDIHHNREGSAGVREANGNFQVTIPARGSGILRISASVPEAANGGVALTTGNWGVTILAATATNFPIRTTHGTSSEAGSRFVLEGVSP